MENGEYKSFETVCGTKTDDSDRPSLKVSPEAVERDKEMKSLFVAGLTLGIFVFYIKNEIHVSMMKKALRIYHFLRIYLFFIHFVQKAEGIFCTGVCGGFL
jgi:hypothetical protein